LAKKKVSSTRLSGQITFKDATIEKVASGTSKYSFGIKITQADKSVTLATQNESVQQVWFTDMTEGITTSSQTMAKQGKTLRVQKRVGGSIAGSSAGKKLIKEVIGPEGYKGIKIIKKVVSSLDGKKKATEIEEIIIKIGVKVVLLVKNNLLTKDDFAFCKTDLKNCCDSLAHAAAFTFEYSVPTLQEKLKILIDGILVMLQYHLTEKNKQILRDLADYLTSERVLDTLYKHQDFKQDKKEWTYLMKNTSAKLDIL